MKQHWRRNSDKRPLRVAIVLVVGLLLAGLLLPRMLAWGGMVVLYPIQATQQWFSQTSMALPALWREKLALQERIDTLEIELSQQAAPSVSERRLREENNRLRTLLAATTSPRVAAAVIGRPGQLPYDILQIDQGSRAGITVGAPVYINQEEVIGLVSQVYPRSALVTLFSTPGFTSTAYVSESDILATIEGFGSGVSRVSIPQGIPLRVGSYVYLPSIQPGVIGQLVSVESEPTQPQQFGYIVQSESLAQVRYVSVGQTIDIATDEIPVQDYIAAISATLQLPDSLQASTTVTSTATSSSDIAP